MATVQSKRKRDTQDIGAVRAPPAMNHQGGHDFDQNYLPTDDDGMDSTLDFSTMVNNTGDVADVGGVDQDGKYIQQTPNGGANANNTDTAAAAIAQYHTMTVPQTTEETFMARQAASNADKQQEGESAQRRASSFGEFNNTTPTTPPKGAASPEEGESLHPSSSKPQVGSEQWHKIRKDNHKEVERRRRETINEGINELAKIVPGCEKNKGQILQRAVAFITQLKENETQNIEKWTLEKLLTEQAIAELSSSCDKLKGEAQRAKNELEQWKRAAQRAGVSLDDDDDGKDDAEAEEAS